MSTSQELERICNVAGYPIYPWAAEQLRKRSELGSQSTRSDDNLTYLANKGAWVRVVSSANLEEKFREYFKSTYQIGLANDRSLAENFILYGGTSTYNFKSQQLLRETPNSQGALDTYEVGDTLGSTTQGMNLRSGLNAYNLIGNQEIQDYGYRPMPGITSVVIDSAGRMGSLRQATINFKVWDKYQLDIMDALYFRLGFTTLIEWGHAKYYDNQGRIQSSEQFMINPFQSNLTKEDIGIKISTNVRQSYGNYGGMLGIITSFNFNMTQDGGYDCTIKAMSLGSVLGNYAITHKSSLANVYFEQLKQYLNNERSKEEKLAYEEAQRIQDAAIKEIEDRLKYSNDQWAKLKIEDPLSNLLFNTKNIDGIYNIDPNFIEKNITSISQSIQYTDAIRKKIEVAPKLTPQANKEKILTDVSTYKLNHDISKLNTLDFNSTISTTDVLAFSGDNYYIESNDATNYGPIIFYAKGSPFYIQQNKDIQVTFDVNKLNQIFLNRQINGFSIIQPPVGNLTQGTTPKYDGKTAFDIVENLRNFAAYPIAYTYQPSGLNFIGDSAKRALFTIGYNYNDKTKASTIFNNPNSTYIVTVIENNGKTANGENYQISIKLQSTEDTSCYITLGEIPFVSGAPSDTYYYESDLSLISYFNGDQSLLTNKPYEDYKNAKLEAERQAANAISDKISNLDDEYNAEALRGTIDSESTIELMLRSVLLFGINNATNPKLLQGEQYNKFLKNLFSEGAYTSIFEKGIPLTPNGKKYDAAFFEKYINGTLNSADRLEVNFMYGNNFYLMSGENAFENDADGRMILKNQLTQDKIPQVNFNELFKVLPVPYGEAADLEVNKKPKLSVYINLGLFFLMLNHTGLLYNKETLGKIKTGDVVTPVTYLDFNPETNYYLSSINQMSLDPYKFLVPYIGKNEDYKKLFNNSLIQNGYIKAVPPKKSSEDQQVPLPAATKLFDFSDDRLSGALPEQKKPKSGGKPNGYIGRLMYVMVDINYLLEEVIQPIKSNSDTNEAYFQTVIEKILTDLNKSMGLYNSFRLSYSDTGNCYVITDDQIQLRPDETIQSVHSRLTENNSNECEIPIYGKSSIARSFEIRTDLSSRLASMIAIASNPGVSDQVSNSKNTSDFGIYNTGSFDRYLPYKMSDPVDSEIESSNAPAAQLAINFNNVVKSIYNVSRDTTNEETNGLFISRDSISKAITYYIDRMAKVKNEQPESVHAMIIPLKSNITMDGMSGLYPFQLYTVDERILPYRYSSTNLSSGPENLKKIAFSISKMTHTISDNQWVTSMDGFMTTLRNPSKEDQSDVREVKPTTIPVTEADLEGESKKNINSNIIGVLQNTQDKLVYTKILNKLGISNPTENQYTFLYAWRTAEASNASWNPFNTTLNLSNKEDYSPLGCNRNQNNGNPVKNYRLEDIGIDATVKTLKGAAYTDLVDKLKKDSSLQVLSTHPALNIWGTGLGINRVLSSTTNTFKVPIISRDFKVC